MCKVINVNKEELYSELTTFRAVSVSQLNYEFKVYFTGRGGHIEFQKKE